RYVAPGDLDSVPTRGSSDLVGSVGGELREALGAEGTLPGLRKPAQRQDGSDGERLCMRVVCPDEDLRVDERVHGWLPGTWPCPVALAERGPVELLRPRWPIAGPELGGSGYELLQRRSLLGRLATDDPEGCVQCLAHQRGLGDALFPCQDLETFVVRCGYVQLLADHGLRLGRPLGARVVRWGG